MGSRSLVNRLLTVTLFASSCLGTLALFGIVPMLPPLTARLASLLPDRSETAADPLQPQTPQSLHSRGLWIAQLPEQSQPRPIQPLRYRLPR